MARRSPKMEGFWERFKPNPESEQGRSVPQVDLYQVLGVPPTSSQDEIKLAFREQAMKFHPDRNPDDPLAEEKYAALSSAYAILGDETQRAAYDLLYVLETPENQGGRGLVKGHGTAEEDMVKSSPAPKKVSRKLDPKAMIENMFGELAKEEPSHGSLFDILSPRQPQQPAWIPIPGTPPSRFNPSANRASMMPAIDIPDYNEILGIITRYWHLEDAVWPFVREVRQTAEFQKAGAIAIDAIAGDHVDASKWGVTDLFNIPAWQAQQYGNTAGGEASYKTVMYSIFEQVTKVMDSLKPSDIPGRFFLEWDATGRVIELIYAENVGRR